jgi:hypothetical protein
MAKFEFVESSTWFIEADTESDAMELWREYRMGGNVPEEMEFIDGYGEFHGEVEDD